MGHFVNGMKDLGSVRVNWVAIFGIGATLCLSVGFWAGVIRATAALVK